MKIKVRLLTLLAVLLLLGGCIQKEAAPAATPQPTPDPTPEPTPEFTIMDDAVEMVPGAVRIPSEEFVNYYTTIKDLDGDLLLASYGDMQEHFTVIDEITGEVLAKRSIDIGDLYYECQVQGDRIVIFSYEKSRVMVLDKNLETVLETPEIPRTGYKYMDSEFRYIYIADYEDDVHIIDVATLEEHDIGLGDCAAYAIGTVGDKLYFTFADHEHLRRECGVLDMKTGEYVLNPTGEMVSNLQEHNGMWFGISSTDWECFILFDGESSVNFVKPEDMSVSLDEATGRIIATSWEGDAYLYNLSGRCLSSVVLDGWLFCGDMVYSPYWDGYFISVVRNDSEESALMFWDTKNPGTGEPMTVKNPNPVRPVGSISELKPLYERADRMSKKYGVSIRIADQCDTEYMNFVADITTDYYALSNSLDMLESAFASLPYGFMEQLVCGDTDEIIMNLVGTLYATNESLPDVYVGFVDFEDGKCKVVFNSHVLDYGTVIHEIAHIIDNRLGLAQYYWPGSIFSESDWLEYQPYGFEYCYDYGGYDFSVDWDYFIDGYSTTYPTEDRARVLEYAAEDMYFWFEGHNGLCRKLDYYSRCIRSSFDTTGWPEYTVWEQMLVNIGWY